MKYFYTPLSSLVLWGRHQTLDTLRQVSVLQLNLQEGMDPDVPLIKDDFLTGLLSLLCLTNLYKKGWE